MKTVLQSFQIVLAALAFAGVVGVAFAGPRCQYIIPGFEFLGTTCGRSEGGTRNVDRERNDRRPVNTGDGGGTGGGNTGGNGGGPGNSDNGHSHGNGKGRNK